MRLRSLVALVILIAWSAASTGVRAAVHAVEPARWQAGYRTLDVSPIPGAPLQHLAVWYPTQHREQAFRSGPFAMQVAASAMPAKGVFPVVALSHGAFGHPINHRDLAIALARAGYMVIAPQHDRAADAGGFGSARQRQGRPAELLFALRTVRASRWFAPHFDARRVGAIGYSAGGYAVLAAMQAKSAWGDVAGHCLRNFISDWNFCYGGSGGLARPANVAGDISTSHPRTPSRPIHIRAAVLLAPVAAVFSATGLAPVRGPIRIYAPDNDQMLNSRFHGDWLYASLKAQGTPAELIVTHAGHYVFMSPFPDALKTEVGAAAQDPPGFDRPAFQQRLARETIAYFERTLRP